METSWHDVKIGLEGCVGGKEGAARAQTDQS
jgi:hypothetical protein